MDPLVLENGNLRLEFDREYGTLTGLSVPGTGWKVLDRPALGLSFRLLVPLEGRRHNPVFGEKQRLHSLQVAPDGRSALLVWDGVVSEHGGKHDIRLSLEVTVRTGQAVYRLEVANNSSCVVENVYCPYLGDVRHPEDETRFQALTNFNARGVTWDMWPVFEKKVWYFGADYPTQLDRSWGCSGTPTSPFILLKGDRQGLYVGVTEDRDELVVWTNELRPGYDNSMDQRVPESDTIGGKDVCVRFAAVHLPYVLPGEVRTLTPIALQAYTGSWHKGVDIYKTWRSENLGLADPRWTAEPHAWQQVHINSPEDELRVRFKDLPRIGEECARHGVKAIQLVGWNDGGQDRGNPTHDPDPRLGTFEELKEAIARIKSMGVKVILFSKFTWADKSSPRYADLERFTIMDPNGEPYQFAGWMYQTVTQFLHINTRRLSPMCFLDEEYLRVCESEFRKVVALDPSGILFDECQHHNPAFLCFHPDHGHRYGASVYGNDRRLIRNFMKIVNDRDFLFAGEGCYDKEFEVYQLGYDRSDTREHIPLMRYVLPFTPLMTAVTGFNDRNMVNQCLMCRYVMSYEPYNFKGRLDDFPHTMEYGKKMDALRAELREYFWDGEFKDMCGATVVTGDGKPHRPYSVFMSRAGRPGVVICNYEPGTSIAVRAGLESGRRLDKYRLVDDPQWRPAAGEIVIPACSAAVVL